MHPSANPSTTCRHAPSHGTAESLPPITVVIATCNRGDEVARAIDTILANPYPSFTINVIDQSDDDTTRDSLERYSADSRVSYHHIAGKGLAHARNTGISRASSEIIAVTDDDCEVPPHWLHDLAASFARDPRIGIVFGNVIAAPYESAKGFIPTYVRAGPQLITRTREKHHADGIGACMGLRRSVWERIGGFDTRFGKGASLHGSSEGELVIRALQRGHWVYEDPSFYSIHHGFRTWQQAGDLVHGYWFGAGAMYGKHFRRAPRRTWRLLVPIAWRWAFGASRVTSSIGPGKKRLRRLLSFSGGFWHGVLRC